MFDVCHVSRGMTSVRGDVRDVPALQEALRRARPEIVLHLAGHQPGPDPMDDPVRTYSTNVLGTVHLLESVRHLGGVKAMLVVTSDQCYEDRKWFWSYREKSTLGGDDPYSTSEACTELVVNAYRLCCFRPEKYEQHGLALASARTGSVLGGGDWGRDKLVPGALCALLENKPIALTSPHAVRPWQHVLEPLAGYLTLAEHLYVDGPRCVGSWNFGPLELHEKSVASVVATLCELWGVEFTWQRNLRPSPQENTYLRLDSSKARVLLHWTPRLDVVTALRWTVDWTKAYQQRADMRAVTESQILAYLEQLPHETADIAGAPLTEPHR
jgi:CDP-glucose 4,6-dehydratase